jgi:hypothetical protein
MALRSGVASIGSTLQQSLGEKAEACFAGALRVQVRLEKYKQKKGERADRQNSIMVSTVTDRLDDLGYDLENSSNTAPQMAWWWLTRQTRTKGARSPGGEGSEKPCHFMAIHKKKKHDVTGGVNVDVDVDVPPRLRPI